MSTKTSPNKYPSPIRIAVFENFEKFDFLSLTHNADYMTICIKSYSPREDYYAIKFDGEAIYGYRNFDEGQLEEYLDSFETNITCGIYKTDNSQFLQWASMQNPFKELPVEIHHYLIVTVNEVVEILSFDDPIIEEVIKH